MNRNLLDLLKIYCTKSYFDYLQEINNKNKENIINLFTDLLILYINDLNSSTLREIITIEVANFSHLKSKLGYDGFQQSSVTDKIQYCEIKPVNCYQKSDGTYNKKLCGQGNFTDFSWKKLAHIKNDDIKMIISGFYSGKLLYILSFDFNESLFLNKLENQLQHNFPNGDLKGFWLRSANFNYKDYENASSLKIIYRNKDLKNYINLFSKKFFLLLKKIN